MNQNKFESLLRFYLSCLDAEEAAQLKLRKDQVYQTHIYLSEDNQEQLFSQNTSKVEFEINNRRQLDFLHRKSLNAESGVDLFYGFPVYIDEKDMICPLFFMEVEATVLDGNRVTLIPKMNSVNVNRVHFIQDNSVEEIQCICDELEGEFGSFDARLKAAKQYIPSLLSGSDQWLMRPTLFRTNMKGTKSDLRYDLTYILKDKSALEKDTALKSFVEGVRVHALSSDYAKNKIILEMASLNEQQEGAVRSGLEDPLFVVTGPPGTGKTQVVTSLISSAVHKSQTVLFSSNNNLPVDGVYERLGQGMTLFGNWILRLGNQSKRDECKKNISSLLEKIINSRTLYSPYATERQALLKTDQSILTIQDKLKIIPAFNDKIAKLVLEEQTIIGQLPSEIVTSFENVDPDMLEESLMRRLVNHSKSSFWLTLRLKLFGLNHFKEKHNKILTLLVQNSSDLAIYKNYLLSDEKKDEAVAKSQDTVKVIMLHQNWAQCIKKRRILESKFKDLPSYSDLKQLKQKKVEISRSLLDKMWVEKICNLAADVLQDLNNYFKDLEDYSPGRHKRLEKSLGELRRFFPIWITTNQSAGKIMPPQPSLFDLVVIDEAGQCDIPSVIPLLYRAKRAVIIGDPHQFRHITSLKDDTEYLMAHKLGIFDIYEEWSYTKRSAFDRSFNATSSNSFLKQHYRCHPDIIEFSNRSFYNGKLVAQVPLVRFQNQLPIKESGVVWHNTPGKAIRSQKGAWNPNEVERTVQVFEAWSKQGLFKDQNLTFGVIAPFSRQVREMTKALSHTSWFEGVKDRFTVGTVHSFQGSECDVLVYSPVVTDDLDGFLKNFAASQSDLINVTVTRARNLLYIVGNLQACQSVSADSPLFKLANYAENLRQRTLHSLNAAEQAMSEILDEVGLTYTPQYSLGKYRLDFLVNSYTGDQYDLEVDGDIHLTADSIRHDDIRDAYVQNKGLKIIRFSARDVMNNALLIKQYLERI